MKLENGIFFSGVEVGGHQIAYDLGEKREFLAKGDILAEGDEVHFVVELCFFSLLGQQGDGVVVAIIAPVGCSDEKIARVLLGESSNEIPSELIAEKRTRCRRLGPEDQVGRHGNRREGLVFQGFEDLDFEVGIVADILRDIWLNSGEAKWSAGWLGAEKLPDAIAPCQGHQGYGDGKVIVCAPRAAFDFEEQAFNGRREHEVGHRNQKGNASYAGDVGDLYEGDIFMQCNAETVPPEGWENNAAEPL